MTRAEVDEWLTPRRRRAAFSAALRRVSNVHDADDVVQQALERLFNARFDLAENAADKMGPWPWLMTAIRSAAHTLLRGRKRDRVAKSGAGASMSASDEGTEHISSHYVGPLGYAGGSYRLRPNGTCAKHGGVYALQRIEAGHDVVYPWGYHEHHLFLVDSCINGCRRYRDIGDLSGGGQ